MSEKQQLAIQMVAILWKTAHEYCEDDIYFEVRAFMDKVITAEGLDELDEIMEGFSDLREKIQSSIHETLWYMEHNWKMRRAD